jgi:tRNA pseudouridine55 synthase
VIRKVKYAAIRHFGKKNLKVGHAGTLDPLATGVLLVCIGKATKLAETLQSHDKEYIAGVTFGATTPSYDLEKEIDRFFPHEHITAEGIQAALPDFIGEQDQVAPLFSAKSVDGVRAYELARKLYKETGENPETASYFDTAAESLLRVSRIHITELELLSFTSSLEAKPIEAECGEDMPPPARGCLTEGKTGVFGTTASSASVDIETETKNASSRINVTDNSSLGLPRASIRMACSKGTYVRAFARDLGEALCTGAHLDSLQRSRSGEFKVENALTVEQTIGMFSGTQNVNN